MDLPVNGRCDKDVDEEASEDAQPSPERFDSGDTPVANPAYENGRVRPSYEARTSRILAFPGRDRLASAGEDSKAGRMIAEMGKTEKAMYIRREILNDSIPEQVLDQIIRILCSRT